MAEPLETRRLLAVSLDGNGWTVVTPSTDSRQIYVSNSAGNDSNDGLSPSTPVKTITKAKSKIRNNKPDWILLKKGDSWYDENFGLWSTSGRSAQEPQLITSYGTGARPLIDSVDQYGFQIVGGMASAINYVSIIGLEFKASAYDGKNVGKGIQGLRFQRQGHDFLVEDCKINGYSGGIIVGNSDAPVSDFYVRRNVIVDTFQYNGHAQGLYSSGTTNGLYIIENVFDHNGWKVWEDKTVFNHNMYINTGAQNVVVDGNIVTRGSLRGVLLRSGGIVTNNFIAQNSVGVQVGNRDSVVNNNVIMEGGDLPGVPSGVGIDVAFDMQDVDIKNNIIAHDWSGYTYNVSAITVNYGIQNAEVTGNIVYDWRRGMINATSGSAAVTVTGNQFQDFDTYHALIEERNNNSTNHTFGNNKYYSPKTTSGSKTPFRIGTASGSYKTYSQWNGSTSDSAVENKVKYVDPNRDAGKYNATLGGGATFDAWIANVRNLSKDNWNTAYTAKPISDYIRDGFQPANVVPGVPLVGVTTNVADTEEAVGTPAQFKISRTGSVASSMVVNYTVGGTATNGSDYVTLTGTTTIPAGSDFVLVNVTPINDTEEEQVEVVDLTITDGGSYDVDSNGFATVRIISEDVIIIDNGGGSGTGSGGDDPVIVDPPPPDPGPGDDDLINDGGNGGAYDFPATGAGLLGDYFDNMDFTNKQLSEVSNIDKFWFDGESPSPSIDDDTFSVRWTGRIQPQYSENYTFTLEADDWARMYINGELVINGSTTSVNIADLNNDGIVNSIDFSILAAGYGASGATRSQGDINGDGYVNTVDFNLLTGHWNETGGTGIQTYSGTVSLERGTLADVVIEYYESAGDAQVSLFWQSNSQAFSLVPTNRMYTPVGYAAAAPLSAAIAAPGVFSESTVVEDDSLLPA